MFVEIEDFMMLETGSIIEAGMDDSNVCLKLTLHVVYPDL